ncbi:MAG: winged helix-turn-helix transcriptional regulator [Candidatus Pacebacteria bacterium]|nr:winged helix-turn-helix transcriptional regulator [Candidatus Paceibacterota bacterium]
MLDILGKSKNAKKIMLILSKFKRLALKEIAKKIKIHENSVRTVLKKLEQNEIINYIVVKTVIGDKSVKEYFLTDNAREIFELNFGLLISSS